MSIFGTITMAGIDYLSSLFVFMVGVFALAMAILFVVDSIQTKDAIRRNYPVIGRFRYIFSTLGEFFRQYFFAHDREEMPFNRAQREWVYRSAKGEDNTVPFGSTQNLTPVGTPIFVNCPFPTLEQDAVEAGSVVIGPYARKPYEPASIMNISGMSYGALSTPAVRALSKGAALAGCWLNTGEGGLAPAHLEGGCDIVFQIGTAKFGVRHEDGRLNIEKLRELAEIPQVRMFEVKMSQGAKPGKGGILPAVKVTKEIAAIRGIPVGQAAISPNRHPEIDSEADLLDFVNSVRTITGKPVGFKAVVGAYGWLERMCEEVNRRGIETAPDFVTVDSGDGGTGAAPMPLMDNVGLPISESLPMVVDILARHGLRERIKVIASGKLITPAEVAWAYCVGTDFVVSARGFMFALGCIQAMKCNRNTCPTGITTHDRRLQKGLNPEDKAVRVKNFVDKMRYGVGVIAHSCGVRHPRELKRFHVRIVRQDGRSLPLNELYPPQEPAVRTGSAS
ncbi:FMN-binding glutamate synthase family protein [uncultured Roseibium sp.]|uniref:FMN-binding glutamate synthase family protein n=1 Tax=uncultured Roseibium sp. TaxID=1936171 RepID=UPI0032165671